MFLFPAFHRSRGTPVGGLTCSCSRHSIAAEGVPLVLSNPKVQGRSCGALHVRAFSAVTRPSFLDYLRSGAEIGFMVAVVSLKGGVQTGGYLCEGGKVGRGSWPGRGSWRGEFQGRRVAARM